MRRSRLTLGLVAMFVIGACTSGGGSPSPAAQSPGGSPAGSAPASPAPSSAYDPSTVSGTVVFSGWQASEEEGAALEAVLADFAVAYPNIEVDYQPVAGDYPAAMTAKFSAGEPPDLFYVDSSVAPEWIEEEVLVDLEPLAAERGFDTSQFYTGYLDAFKGPEGGVFGTPFASTSSGAWTTAADRLRLGATNGSAVNLTVDDVLIGSGSMPS